MKLFNHKIIFALAMGLITGAGLTYCDKARCDDFSTTDTNLQIASQALLVADWSQTLDIKNHPELRETNPILGSHPSDDKIHLYFASAIIANQLIAMKLEGDNRTAWQVGIIILESIVVIHNRQIGVKFTF